MSMVKVENIVFTVFMVVMAVLIFITAQSRFTGKEPSLLDHKLYIVDSGSMSPTIKVNSMIIVKEMNPRNVRERDIITYYGSKDSKVTHRVIKVENQGRSFITRGDANSSNDPLPLDGEKIIGKVVFTLPFIGYVFRFLSTAQGITLLIILGSLWVLLPKLLPKESIEAEETEAVKK